MDKAFKFYDDEEKKQACINYNDCSICHYAIHKKLLSTTKHTCAIDMTEDEYNRECKEYSDPYVGTNKNMAEELFKNGY